ncbi:hypothetical protein CTZ27_11600 [Streptomyces griseocarneus]|nr:hypothetical protein CTZ27_11600 [Streptomyces griseocarneus]
MDDIADRVKHGTSVGGYLTADGRRPGMLPLCTGPSRLWLTAPRTGSRSWRRTAGVGRTANCARGRGIWRFSCARPVSAQGRAVSLRLPRSARLVASLLAVFEAGGTAVVLDPRTPTERLSAIETDAGCVTALVPAEAPARLGSPLSVAVPACPDADHDATESLAVRGPEDDLDRVACAFYTSWSTGRPKGVQVAPPGALRTLHTVLTGGGTADPRAFAQVRAACPQVILGHVYGPTECTTFTTLHALPPGSRCPRARVPIGAGLAGVAVRLLGPALAEVPVGESGEVYVAGEQVAPGYLGLVGLTAERSAADPYGPAGARMYRTGDLAVRGPDGTLKYLARDDDQVKIRGHRVGPGEARAALADLPGVARVVVTAHRRGGSATADRSAAGRSAVVTGYRRPADWSGHAQPRTKPLSAVVREVPGDSCRMTGPRHEGTNTPPHHARSPVAPVRRGSVMMSGMVAISPERQCTATTKKGYRCPTGTARHSGLCHVHDPALQCGRPTRRGRCGVATGGGPCKAHRESEPGPGQESLALETPEPVSEPDYPAPIPWNVAARTLNLG